MEYLKNHKTVKFCGLVLAWDGHLLGTGTTISSVKGSHTPVHDLICSIICRQHKICILQETNAAEAWLSSMIQLSPTIGLALTKHEQSDDPGRFATLWQLTSHPGWVLAQG